MLTDGTITYWLQIVETLLPWVVFVLLVGVALYFVVLGILNLLDMRRLLRQKVVFLELTPPAQTDKTQAATQRLFSVLHGLEAARSPLEKLLRRKEIFSLEMVSRREEGIRYVLRVAERDAPTFEQAIVSYLPDLRFRRVTNPLQGTDFRHGRLLEVRQAGHFAYPLHDQGMLFEHDPIAYLTGAMTKLSAGEFMTVQLVVSPTHVREADTISRRILHNEELVYDLGRWRLPLAEMLFNAINSVLFSVLDGIGDTFSGFTHRRPSDAQAQHKQQAAMKIKPARALSAFELKLAESVHDKLNQPLYGVSIRALIVADDKEREKQRVKSLKEWISAFSVPKYQALRVRPNVPILSNYRQFAFEHRLPTLLRRNSCILAASELADVYHFPHAQTTKTENVVKSLSRTLPAPISLKGNSNFDVILGRNHHHGATTDIGLSTAERERHVYVIGGTGNGKTTLLKYGIVQDMRNGKGVAVIDPHGDLAAELLRYVPDNRIKDVIYFNPADLSYPIGLNLLELPEGVTGDELLDAKDFITEAVISIMRKIFSDDDTGGHRIEYVLRNTVQTALTIKDATLFTVFDLLTDTKYRKKIVKSLENQKLKNFWSNEMGKAGNFQRVKMSAGITAKIGRFQFSGSAERILSQPKSTINFEESLDGKILICNFAKGLIGEDTSELFGISTLAKLQLAAYRRVKQQQSERKPFYLYVDEFQNFATMSFVQMLSEARKYKVFLTMAEQTTSQQDDLRMINTILANVGTVVCFKSGNPHDEQLMLPLFSPYIQPGDIANLPTYNFYARLGAVLSQEPVSGETLLLESEGSGSVALSVIQTSRTNYATRHKAKDEPVKKMKQPKDNKFANSVGSRPGD